LASSNVDTLSGFENIQGSAGTDYLVGSSSANTITGGAGADYLLGGSGADTFTIGATESLNTALDNIGDFTALTDIIDLVTLPTSVVAATAAGTTGAELVTAANYASSGTTTGTLATDLAAIVALAGANAFDQVGDTIVVTITGASIGGTAVTYIVQNQAVDATYDAAADTVIVLTGTSTVPLTLASFI